MTEVAVGSIAYAISRATRLSGTAVGHGTTIVNILGVTLTTRFSQRSFAYARSARYIGSVRYSRSAGICLRTQGNTRHGRLDHRSSAPSAFKSDRHCFVDHLPRA